MIYAVWKWIRHGGWLLMRKSHAGPYPHFIHAARLPDDLPVSQFVVDDPTTPCWLPLFRGDFKTALDGVEPPPVKGYLDWPLLLFWVTYFIGMVALLVLAIKLVFAVG